MRAFCPIRFGQKSCKNLPAFCRNSDHVAFTACSHVAPAATALDCHGGAQAAPLKACAYGSEFTRGFQPILTSFPPKSISIWNIYIGNSVSAETW